MTQGTDDCIGHPKVYGHCLIDRIMEELGLPSLIRAYKGFSKIQYDVLGYFKLMVYGRILSPASKLTTAKQNERYYEPIVTDSYEYHIYDTLDFIYAHKKQLFNRIHTAVVEKVNRKADIIYYDVTNFYYEIEDPDETIKDEDGKIVSQGLRQMGVSKENRKQPIVQMGLFMDNSGIPISCEIFSGNTLDHQTVRTSLKNTVDNMSLGRFIFVGDRGMCCYTNLLHILSCGNGYIVSKSIVKSKKEEQDFIYDEGNYTVISENFKYKSRIVTRTEKDEKGNIQTITEKVVVYWDRHFYDREVHENRTFLQFLEKLQQSPNNFRITATQCGVLRRFVKNEYLHKITGEVTSASEWLVMLDTDKIEAFKRNFGYYQIVTSEIHLEDRKIIDIYHGLSQIEDQFRVMKGDFCTRPMYVSTAQHIEAHLTLCTISLIILRILQKRICEVISLEGKQTAWTYGISAERIQNALNQWTVEKFPNDYYRFNNIDDVDLSTILKAFHLEIPKKFFRISELKHLKSYLSLSNEGIN